MIYFIPNFVTLNFFDSVIQFLDSIATWFETLISNFVSIMSLLFSFFSFPNIVSESVPYFLSLSIAVVLAIYIVRFILLK